MRRHYALDTGPGFGRGLNCPSTVLSSRTTTARATRRATTDAASIFRYLSWSLCPQPVAASRGRAGQFCRERGRCPGRNGAAACDRFAVLPCQGQREGRRVHDLVAVPRKPCAVGQGIGGSCGDRRQQNTI